MEPDIGYIYPEESVVLLPGVNATVRALQEEHSTTRQHRWLKGLIGQGIIRTTSLKCWQNSASLISREAGASTSAIITGVDGERLGKASGDKSWYER